MPPGIERAAALQLHELEGQGERAALRASGFDMSSDLRHMRIKRGLTCACKAPVCDYVHCRRIINPPLNLQVAARAAEHEAPPGRGPRRAHFGGHEVADDGRRRAGCGVAAA